MPRGEKNRRNMVVKCVYCNEEHDVVLIGGAQFDPSTPCDNCGRSGAYEVVSDDGQDFGRAQCMYCDHVVPITESFTASSPCPKCGRSGAYIMLDE